MSSPERRHAAPRCLLRLHDAAEAILAALADLQVSVDALGTDVQHVLQILTWTPAPDDPEPPEWVSGTE